MKSLLLQATVFFWVSLPGQEIYFEPNPLLMIINVDTDTMGIIDEGMDDSTTATGLYRKGLNVYAVLQNS